MDYTDWDADDLLTGLETAGRHPDPGLVRACLAKREEITPTLLEWLGAGVDESWHEHDPRWYREIHAGLLLIEFREEAALPLFDEILRDPDREETLSEWFNTRLPGYGGAIV